MGFMTELENQTNESITENGAVGFKTTKSFLLDLNFAVSSLRALSDTDVIVKFRQAYAENKELGIKWLFYARDARKGLGERRLFRLAIKDIANELDSRVFNWIAEFGRYDDLFALIDTHLQPQIITFIKSILQNDAKAMENKQPISLLAKWMPSENTSSPKTRALATKIRKLLEETPKDYRKFLTKLRTHINIVEKHMSKKEWTEIDYEAVPSRANLMYNGAFLRNDEKRRREFLGKLEKGEAKINAGTLYPHDILHKYGNYVGIKEDAALEALWKNLPNFVKGDKSTIVVADTSGSMTMQVGQPQTRITAKEVAAALAIYFAERCHGQYKDKFITFSSEPKFINLSGLNTLHKKWAKYQLESIVDSTDIEKVFNLLLKTAIDAKVPQEQIPNILVISDMEFNSSSATGDFSRNSDKLMNIIEKRWNAAGYQLPKLSYWNVCGRTLTIPKIENKSGLALVSGFSPAVIQQVLSIYKNPYDALCEILLSDRYKHITLK